MLGTLKFSILIYISPLLIVNVTTETKTNVVETSFKKQANKVLFAKKSVKLVLLKLLVNKETNKVLFTKVGKDC
jgi:hypothetical protein